MPVPPSHLRHQYDVERELADRLRHASKAERRTLYTTVYDEFYRRVPDQPQLARKADPLARRHDVAKQMTLLRRFLHPSTSFLEIGPGDGSLSFEVAKFVAKVCAVDVSHEIVRGEAFPSNFALTISDGSSVPVAAESIDVAYSNQLMEHLHPDDAADQLLQIVKALRPGGIYLCRTPNRLSGPHDVSKYFDDEAHGFHLKEYTFTELDALFRTAGFRRTRAFVGVGSFYVPFSLAVLKFLEACLSKCSPSLRKSLARHQPFKALLGVILLGQK